MPYSFEMTSDILEIGTPHFVPEIATDTFRKLYTAEILTDAELMALPRQIEISMHGATPVAPDFINAAGPTVVSERVAKTIRALEPDLHRLMPLEVVWRATGMSCGTYVFVLVTETVEHFDYDRTAWLTKTDGGFGRTAAEASQYRLALGYNEPCVLRAGAIAGRHVWRGAPEGTRKIYFCSDAFRDAARIEEWRGARFIEVGVV
ncbi:MAG: DUF1629 domain-containing protein [Pseudomonadota bacterium]